MGTFYGKNMSARFTNTRDIDEYTRFWKSKKIDADDFRRRGFLSDDFRTAQGDAVQAYTKRRFGELPFSVEYIDKKTEAFEFFMMGLRMTRGICRETYEKRFGAFPEKAEALFTAWEERGLALRREKNGAHFYALTKDGLLFLNEFLEALL